MIESGRNNIYIKRDDLLPFSFGGNKARKAFDFLEDLTKKKANFIVTYGSSSSNHCRIIANVAKSIGLPCLIITPEESFKPTFNSKLMKCFGAEFVFSSYDKIHDTIEDTISKLKDEGYNPYFIMGGGHGNIGTNAYVKCFDEILQYETDNKLHFDYIFHASGTGTTQAGLVCGKLINNSQTNIVGISIARKNPYGSDVIIQSVQDYLEFKKYIFSQEDIKKNIHFIDSYTSTGYGKSNKQIANTIQQVMSDYGIPLDETYTGKAYYGMKQYIQSNNLCNKNILFIHTGGTPLFFDFLNDGGE